MPLLKSSVSAEGACGEVGHVRRRHSRTHLGAALEDGRLLVQEEPLSPVRLAILGSSFRQLVGPCLFVAGLPTSMLVRLVLRHELLLGDRLLPGNVERNAVGLERRPLCPAFTLDTKEVVEGEVVDGFSRADLLANRVLDAPPKG